MRKLTLLFAMLALAGCTDPSGGSAKNSSGTSGNERQNAKDQSNNSVPASASGKGVNASDVNGMSGTVGTSKEPGAAAGQSGEGTSRPEEPKR